MNTEDQARWTVVVPRDIDKDLRVYLAENGMRKGDLSKYIEEAVRWRLFNHTVGEARKGFEDMEPGLALDLIEEAVSAVRRERPAPAVEPS